jgi:hypothetical protein
VYDQGEEAGTDQTGDSASGLGRLLDGRRIGDQVWFRVITVQRHGWIITER